MRLVASDTLPPQFLIEICRALGARRRHETLQILPWRTFGAAADPGVLAQRRAGARALHQSAANLVAGGTTQADDLNVCTSHNRLTVTWLMLPVVPVIIVVLAFNFMADGLRDAADPYS